MLVGGVGPGVELTQQLHLSVSQLSPLGCQAGCSTLLMRLEGKIRYIFLSYKIKYLLVPPPARFRVESEASGRMSSSHAGACGLRRTLGNIKKRNIGIKTQHIILPCLSTMISHEQKMQKKQEQMKMAMGTRSMNM